MVSDIIFTTDGKRTEHVVRSPVPSLHKILLTPEDMEDLRSVQPFVLTTNELPNYLIRYLGHQQVDEIGTLRVRREAQKDRRSANVTFPAKSGWMTAIFRSSRATAAPSAPPARRADNAFPKFETYREQIDGKILVPHLHHRQRHAALQR